ncbi:MAG: hypothetical protein HOI50_01665 [Verrucomicrobia bacterium]|jgi:hypothetical protein|nr:hypothetical protein [Verrucomicrobiota bacterium]
MPSLQELIHKFEEGEGTKSITKLAILLAFVALLIVYNVREYRNFSSPEAMELSQLARNVSEGKGFTTQSIRPFSLAMVGSQRGEEKDDPMMLKQPHPDLTHPPVYPFVLSLWMKVMPFQYDIPSLRAENFRRYQPEVLISFLNQLFFIISGIVLFFLSRRLFDPSVAWLSTAVFFGSDVLWRFSVSGLSTMVSILFFIVLVACLVVMERASGASNEEGGADEDHEESEEVALRPGPRSVGWYLGIAAIAGLMIGLGVLTRYSLLWLLLPSLLFVGVFVKPHKVPVILTMLAVSLLVVAPWLVRNYQLSGALFGVSSYNVVMDTSGFPGDRIERTMSSNIGTADFSDYRRKLLANAPEIITEQLPTLGGSWLSMFFFVGLMIPFNNPGLRRLRFFAVACMGLLIVVQALGRTHMSEMSPLINGQNHLILLAPVLYMFGAAFFFTLLDQLTLPFDGARNVVILGVFMLVSSPLVLRLLPPRTTPIVYPPYSPPLIQEIGYWNDSEELMMSDMPWAVAWYGDRPCLWITRNIEPDFYKIHDQYAPIKSVYLTPLTTNRRFMSEVLKDSDAAWARFYMDVQLRQNLPKGFPLKYGHPGVMPDQLYVSDRQRWLPVFQE